MQNGKLKNGAITILCDREYVKIEIHDQDAAIQFLEIEMTPEYGEEGSCRGPKTLKNRKQTAFSP